MTTAAKTPGSPVPPAYPLCELKGVEIFEDGVYRGRPYTPADVDEMIANFERFGPAGLNLLTPVVVLGHEEDQRFLDASDLPAAGVLARVYRGPDGKARADFRDMPEPVAALVSARAYRKVSIELYDQDRPFDAGDGRVFAEKIIRRVALLGGEIPQVKTLADLPVPVFQYADRFVAAYQTPAGGACFAFSETRPVTKAEKVAKLRTHPKFARCFADGEGGAVTIDRPALVERVKAALAGVDQATLDSLSDEQLMGLALGTPPAPAATGGSTDMDDAPFDRAAAISELTAMGQDATALEAMTDDDLKALLAQLKAAPTPMRDRKPAAFSDKQKAELERTRKLNAELEAANKRTAERLAQARKDEVHAFCDKLVREGRLLPAQRPTVERDLLAADDADPCHKFHDGKAEVPVTAYELRRRELAAWPVVVRFGEAVKAGGAATDDAVETERVRTFATAHAETLRKAGKTPDQFVHQFSELRKKKPALTARQYGVPAEFCV